MAPASIIAHVRVLLVSAFDAPFIQDDIEHLRRHVRLRTRIRHGIASLPGLMIGVIRSDVVICWFASVYAFVAVAIARMTGVRTCVVVGGVDASKDPEFGYGIWLSPWRSKLVRYVFRNATRILVVDQSLKDSAVRLAEYDGANIQVLPTGYNSAFWRPVAEKEPIVLTVAVARDEITLRRKGLDTLVETARLLPGVTFTIVGTEEKLLQRFNPPLNVKCYGRMAREDVVHFYQRAKVYCQPSRREGLPNALCEAMLCGCIPVGSAVNGIPTAIGDTGFFVEPGKPDELALSIRLGLASGETASRKARARIVALFPMEKRESGLVRTITEIAG
jgi:glycosyltransferase involved in cell wall biosynthesis